MTKANGPCDSRRAVCPTGYTKAIKFNSNGYIHDSTDPEISGSTKESTIGSETNPYLQDGRILKGWRNCTR